MSSAAFDLTGHVALVSGAGSPDGIGFAAARLLGAMGAAVAVSATTERAHDRAAELRAAGVVSSGVVADLTAEDQVERAVADVVADLGAPTVLVNNAGMTSTSDPALDVSTSGGAESGDALTMAYSQWRRALARNLDTAFLLTRAVLPHMRGRRWGRVVNASTATETRTLSAPSA